MRTTAFKLSAIGCILGAFCIAAIFPSTGNQRGHGGAVNIVNYGSGSLAPAATPTPTETPTPTPSATPIDHVADANARLSLDPTTHPTDTFQVIQDDDGLTYTFIGPGADADAGLWVTGAGTVDRNGSYIFNGVDYSQIGGSNTCTGGIISVWQFNSEARDYMSLETTDYAWQVTTWIKGLNVANPVPVVIRNPIASEANWSHS